jgi:hypothetical protein
VNYNIENERYYASMQDRHGVTSNIEIQNVYTGMAMEWVNSFILQSWRLVSLVEQIGVPGERSREETHTLPIPTH